MASPDNLIDYLNETSTSEQAARADGKSMKYVARMQSATWDGMKDGQAYVKVGGKKVPVSSVHAGTSVRKGDKINVRYANGKYVAFW